MSATQHSYNIHTPWSFHSRLPLFVHHSFKKNTPKPKFSWFAYRQWNNKLIALLDCQVSVLSLEFISQLTPSLNILLWNNYISSHFYNLSSLLCDLWITFCGHTERQEFVNREPYPELETACKHLEASTRQCKHHSSLVGASFHQVYWTPWPVILPYIPV